MKRFGRGQRTATALFAGVIASTAVWMSVDGAHAWTFKTLYSFCAEQQCTDGDWPMGTLLIGSDGNLYGITNKGGPSDHGVVYQVSPKAHHIEKVLYSFCPDGDCSTGSLPEYGLIEDIEGTLYGSTHGGARNYSGTIFKLTPDVDRENWAFDALYKFCSKRDCADGSLPSPLTYAGASTGLRYDGVSPLYGTTYSGGKYNGGTAFKLEPPAGTGRWNEQVLHDYCVSCTTDGAQPWSGLLVESSGNLLGTTSYGGSHGEGTLFELTAIDKKWKQSILYEFCALGSCADGDTPMATLISDAAGNLYGTTHIGGKFGYGTLFKLTRNGGITQETVLHSFCSGSCVDGGFPEGLVMDPAGHIFGTTQFGGDQKNGDGGTIFEFAGDKFKTLHTFCSLPGCTDGDTPPYTGGLILDAKGNLYGTTLIGGAHHGGTLFRLSP